MKPALAPIAGDHISQTVARVWQQVLLVPVRTADDDFFDSGGDSLKAITFVIELERALGLEISLTLINETPRFDQLCQALRERRAPGSTPLVTLKAGDGLPPLFFIHGVGGNVVEILPAARRVTYPGAVIGIRARGVVRGEVPHTSIEAMAADYLRAIKERQPNGPYYLCGYSSGGLVAFEIARRLSESGDDSRPGRALRHDDESGAMAATDLALYRRPAHCTPRRRVAAYAIRTWPATLRKSAERLRAWHGSLGAAPPIAIRVAASALIASAKYHPGFYRGQLTLFSPAEREPGLPSLESVWRNACSNGRRRRDCGNPLDDALHAPCGNDRRMCDAAPARCKFGLSNTLSGCQRCHRRSNPPGADRDRLLGADQWNYHPLPRGDRDARPAFQRAVSIAGRPRGRLSFRDAPGL